VSSADVSHRLIPVFLPEHSTMPAAKIICPECEAVLKPTKPVPDGRRVKCPKCGEPFTTPGLGGEEAEEKVVRRAAPSKSAGAAQPSKAPAKKKKAAEKPAPPPAASKPKGDDDDEEGGTYGYIKEEEPDPEDKPQIDYAPDMSIRDLRGPAQAKVMRPSNGLMIGGALGLIFDMLVLAWAVWPFLFSEHVVDHVKVLEEFYGIRSASDDDDKPKQNPQNPAAQKPKKDIPKERKDLSDEDLAIVEKVESAEIMIRVITAVVYFLAIVYCGFQIVAAVKMQNLESYGWSMAAAILGMIPFGNFWLVSLPCGIWALVTLRDEEVIAGFEYVPE
jgi:DNA-directed RNA polymerase subunit M/transcription elongation factor TFIIS